MMEARIYHGLIQRGLPDAVAKAAVANMIAESGLRTDINEIAPVVPGSRGGYGLNQWTGPRRRDLEAFAAQRGAAPSDLDVQLDFMMMELGGSEKAAMAALSGASDPVEAARIYSERFLRPGIPNMSKRLAEARRLAGLDMGPGGSPGSNAFAGAAQDATAAPERPQMIDTRIDPRPFMLQAGNAFEAPPLQYQKPNYFGRS